VESTQQGLPTHLERVEELASNILNSGYLARDTRFITTSCNTSLGSMQDILLPVCPTTFAKLVTSDLPVAALQSTPIEHRTRRVVTPVVPRQSAHLAKKVVNRTPVAAAAQNLLMHKLGLLQARNEIDLAEFDRYIKLFAEGLPESHAQMINDMFMDHIPVSALAESAEIVEE
jgi:hypothetical protein